MTKQQIDFDEFENNKIERFSKLWKLDKPKTVKRFVKDFPEDITAEMLMGDLL